MATLTDYKGLEVVTPDPTGAGGLAIQDDLKELADRDGPVHEAAANPTVNDDDADTAGNGKFYKWSKWRNTSTNSAFICLDPTATAAVWKDITAGSPGGADTQVQFNDSSSFGGDANFTFNKSTDALSITGSVDVDNLKLDGNTVSSQTGIPYGINLLSTARECLGVKGTPCAPIGPSPFNSRKKTYDSLMFIVSSALLGFSLSHSFIF